MTMQKGTGICALAIGAALTFAGCATPTQDAVVQTPTGTPTSTTQALDLARTIMETGADTPSTDSPATITTDASNPTVTFSGSPITISLPSTGYTGTSPSSISTFTTTQTNTYVGAQPTQAGIRLLTATSGPVTESFPISLPASTTPAEGPDGELAFTNETGESIAVTTSPWAKTTDGQWLPSTLQFQDGALVQQVAGAKTDQAIVAGFDFFALSNTQPAATPDNLGKSNWLIVRTYPSTPPAWPQTVYLRAGSKKWGYDHLVKNGRWNPWFDGMMGVTVAHPNEIKEDPPSTQVRVLKIRNCPKPYNFRVVIQKKGHDTDPNIQKGIITAYQEFI